MIRKINPIFARPLSENNIEPYVVPTGVTYLNKIIVDANELSSPNVYTLRSVILKSGTTNSYTFRLYWNTTVTTAGATLLASYTLPATTIQYIAIARYLYFDTNSTLQIMNPNYTAAASDIGDFPTTASTITVSNWLSNSGYFFVSCDAAPSGVDSVGSTYLSIET